VVVHTSWGPACVVVVAVVVFLKTRGVAATHSEDCADTQEEMNGMDIHECVNKFNHFLLQVSCSVQYDLCVYSNS
jgi:hypothetical protein